MLLPAIGLASDPIIVGIQSVAISRLATIDRGRSGRARIVAAPPMIARLWRALASEAGSDAHIFGGGIKLRSAVRRRADRADADNRADCARTQQDRSR